MVWALGCIVLLLVAAVVAATRRAPSAVLPDAPAPTAAPGSAFPAHAVVTRLVTSPVDLGPPTRSRVFGEFLLRSLILALGGGAALGSVFGPIFLSVWMDPGFETAWLAAVAGGVAGAIYGTIFGVVAGLVMGAVGAAWLVPYRGVRVTIRTVRLLAVTVTALWTSWIIPVDLEHPWRALLVVTLPASVGALLLSPWVARWYVRRMPESSNTPHGARTTS